MTGQCDLEDTVRLLQDLNNSFHKRDQSQFLKFTPSILSLFAPLADLDIVFLVKDFKAVCSYVI